MSHMVIYRSAEGKPGYHQTEELDDAVSYVESLRNNEGVEHARIFRLEEVTFDFKPYFKVEIGGAGAAPAAAAPAVAPAPVVAAPPPAPEPPSSVPPPPPAPPVAEAPVAESSTLAPPAPPAPPEVAEASDDDSNGVGARRGLFGR